MVFDVRDGAQGPKARRENWARPGRPVFKARKEPVGNAASG